MEHKSKAESKVITDVTWVLNAEERAKIKNFAGTPVLLYHRCPSAKWKVFVDVSASEETSTEAYIGAYLLAIPQSEDYLEGTSKFAWIRRATLRVCEMTSQVGSRTVLHCAKDSEQEDQFEPEGPSSGFFEMMTTSEVNKAIDDHNSLVIRFEFSAPQTQPLQAPPDHIALVFFDDHKCSDVVFRFPAVANAKPRYIFAFRAFLASSCAYFDTLFNSGFAETTNSNSIDLTKLSASSALDRSLTFDNSELRPFYTAACSDAQSSPVQSRQSEQTSKDQEGQNDTARSSKRKRSNTDEVEGISSSLPIIDITETDFTTYRAMLAYFHTSLVPFTSLPSDYLVARQEALKQHDSVGGESFDFEEPEIWFSDAFSELVDQKDWHGIRPCSPHSMFRLADCYRIKELRELAKSRILRSLTVDNVAYELFSPLSFDYEEIQEAVLKFFNEHWAEVKSTKALETVLEKFAAGELPEALELVKKVWLAMEPVKKNGDVVVKEK